MSPKSRRPFRLRVVVLRHERPWVKASFHVIAALLAFFSFTAVAMRGEGEDIPDITGKYHFLSDQDTLALLEQEGKLKGWIDVVPEEEESDTILSYQIIVGWRKNDHLEFKTSKIHQKYFRFTGAARRGAGPKEGDPDYLRLVGDLETIRVKPEGGEEVVRRKDLIFKSMGKNESEE